MTDRKVFSENVSTLYELRRRLAPMEAVAQKLRDEVPQHPCIATIDEINAYHCAREKHEEKVFAHGAKIGAVRVEIERVEGEVRKTLPLDLPYDVWIIADNGYAVKHKRNLEIVVTTEADARKSAAAQNKKRASSTRKAANVVQFNPGGAPPKTL